MGERQFSELVNYFSNNKSRAVTLTDPGMLQTNVYNGLDTRVGSTTNSVANIYLRDGAYVTDAVLKDSTATFTPGVSERRGSTTTFSHSGLKNADAQSSVSQAVNATQQYDAFGNLASSTGTWIGQFGYGGGFGYQQDATGLKLLGHRYYDASTGRFLTRDPIKDGRNWYVYVGNDPIGGADPEGLEDTRLDSLFKRLINKKGLSSKDRKFYQDVYNKFKDRKNHGDFRRSIHDAFGYDKRSKGYDGKDKGGKGNNKDYDHSDEEAQQIIDQVTNKPSEFSASAGVGLLNLSVDYGTIIGTVVLTAVLVFGIAVLSGLSGGTMLAAGAVVIAAVLARDDGPGIG